MTTAETSSSPVLPEPGSVLIKVGAAPQNTFTLTHAESQGNKVAFVGRLLGVAENQHARKNDLVTMTSYRHGRDFAVVTPICCCCDKDKPEPYCGDPWCDIFYCLACGDEFEEPCARHEGVPHE